MVELILASNLVPYIEDVSYACSFTIPVFDEVEDHFKAMPENFAMLPMYLYRAVSSQNEQLLATVISFVRLVYPEFFPLKNDGTYRMALQIGQPNLIRLIISLMDLINKKLALELIEHASYHHELALVTELISREDTRSIIPHAPSIHTSPLPDLMTEIHNRMQRSIHYFDTNHADLIQESYTALPSPPRLTKKSDLVVDVNNAIHLHCPDMLTHLLSHTNIHLVDARNCSPLVTAAVSHNTRAPEEILAHIPRHYDIRSCLVVRLLLNQVLHEAASTGDVIVLEEFVRQGARISHARFGITALHVAAKLGDIRVMQIVLAGMSSVDVDVLVDKTTTRHHRMRDGMTALALAAVSGHVRTVEVLVERGASIEVRDRRDTTPLLLAEGAENQLVVEVFMRVKVNVNE